MSDVNQLSKKEEERTFSNVIYSSYESFNEIENVFVLHNIYIAKVKQSENSLKGNITERSLWREERSILETV